MVTAWLPGFRWHKTGEGNVGLFVAGMFNEAGELQKVGEVRVQHGEASRVARILQALTAGGVWLNTWGGWQEPDAVRNAAWWQSRLEPGQRHFRGRTRRPELVGRSGLERTEADRVPPQANFRQMAHGHASPRLTSAQLEVVPPPRVLEIFLSSR